MSEKKPQTRVVTHPLDRVPNRQVQPTSGAGEDAKGAVARILGLFYKIFIGAFTFTLIAAVVIIPTVGLFGFPVLLVGLVLAFIVVIGGKKKAKAAETRPTRPTAAPVRVSAPVTETRDPHEHSYECEHSNELSPKKRLEQLERLYKAGLYTKEEYREKRLEIMRNA